METFTKDTDGFIAPYVDRQISAPLTQALLKTPIQPLHITIFVTLLGIFAGWCFARGTHGWQLTGAIVLLVSSILSGCDGELARARRMTTPEGMWLNIWGKNLTYTVVFYCIGLGLFRQTGNSVFEILGFVTALSTLLSSSMSSYNLHLKSRGGFQQGTVRKLESGELLYVDGPTSRQRIMQLIDLFATRDFIYVLLALTIASKLAWFLYATAGLMVASTFILILLLF